MDKAARTEWLNNLKESDTVFLKFNRYELNLTVEKVGRQYIHLTGNRKVEKVTGVQRSANGSGTAGMIYPSREAYEAGIQRLQNWHDLARDIRNISSRPAHLSDEDIQTIRALLFPH